MGFFSKILKPPKPGKFYNPGKNFVNALKPSERAPAAPPPVSARQQEWMARITAQQQGWQAKVEASRQRSPNAYTAPAIQGAADNSMMTNMRAAYKIDPRNQVGGGQPMPPQMVPGAGVRRPMPSKMVGLPAPSAPVAPPQMQYADPAPAPAPQAQPAPWYLTGNAQIDGGGA